jgi:hypothetical protein
MGFAETMIFYHVIGAGVAIAVYLSNPHRRQFPAFRVATALVFWPLYLPILLEGKRSERRSERSADQEARGDGARVERTLPAKRADPPGQSRPAAAGPGRRS